MLQTVFFSSVSFRKCLHQKTNTLYRYFFPVWFCSGLLGAHNIHVVCCRVFFSSNQMHGFSGNSCENYDSQLSLQKIHLKSACLHGVRQNERSGSIK